MASRPMKRSRISDEDWNDARPHLYRLYKAKNKTAKQVAEEMKLTLGATVDQYRSKFNDWGWTKNRKTDETDQVVIILQQRKPNTPRNVFEWGNQLSEAQVKAIVQRSRPTTLARLENRSLPSGWVIRTPKQDRTQALTDGLPFLIWEQGVREVDWIASNLVGQPEVFFDPRFLQDLRRPSDNALQRPMPLSVLTQRSLEYIRSFSTPLFTQSSALSALDSILPSSLPSLSAQGGLGSHLESRINITLLHRQVLHSLANNFSGISGFPVWQPIEVLDTLGIETVSQLVLRKTSLTARAIARSLIKGAIEIGEQRIIHAILSDNFLGIKIDDEVCLMHGQKYTALERAVMGGHGEVVAVMIRHGANVDKTFPCVTGDHHYKGRESPVCAGCPDGALSHAIDNTQRHHHCQIGLESVSLLMQSAERISHKHLRLLIQQNHVDLVTSVIQHYGVKYSPEDVHSNKTEMATLIDFMSDSFTEDKVLEILELVYKLGFEAKRQMLATAIKLGYMRLYNNLCSEHGLVPDLYTFFTAIRCCNKSFIGRLMDSGAFTVRDYDAHRTPLSEAIHTGDRDTIEVMREEGAFELLKSWRYFRSAWRAALYMADLSLINELIHINKDIPAAALGHALSQACLKGDRKLSVTLLGLGADLEVEQDPHFYTMGPALLSALKGRHASLVELLLSAGANPLADGAIRLAVEWGHHPIIEKLLKEGAVPCKTSLIEAIEREDLKLISLLLSAGANIDDGALEAAVRHGSLHMVRYILGHGADTNDAEALVTASLLSKDILVAILEAHKLRYRERQRGFGSKALCKAINRQDKPMIDLLLLHEPDLNGFVEHQQQFITPFGIALTVEGGQNIDLVQRFLASGCLPHAIVSGLDELVGRNVKHSSSKISTRVPAPRVTAFLAAVSTGNTELVSLLAQEGADARYPADGRIRRTPLQLAAEGGCYPMVELLHNLGADVNEKPNRIGGATALQLASIGGFNKIVCYLLSNGADVDAPGATVDGCTALEGAATHGRMDTVHILLKAGAADKGRDTTQINGAIQLAKENAHPDTASLLELYQGNGQLEHDLIPDLDLDDYIHDGSWI